MYSTYNITFIYYVYIGLIYFMLNILNGNVFSNWQECVHSFLAIL